MSDTITPVAKPAIVRLDWECDHFGLLVAELATPDLTDLALTAALRQARDQGVQLLVWPARGGRRVSEELLDAFDGALVDRKATFRKPLPAALAKDGSNSIGPCSVVPCTSTSASTSSSGALYELAIAAGLFSRFKVDRHLPKQKFEAMYRRWMERSLNGELADIVLVAPIAGRGGGSETTPAGMITLSESDGVGSIGLVAVATACRGRSIGSSLMHAGHQWMRSRDAREARVVTQLANTRACRLYERSGYRLSQLQHYYHFWPQTTLRDP